MWAPLRDSAHGLYDGHPPPSLAWLCAQPVLRDLEIVSACEELGLTRLACWITAVMERPADCCEVACLPPSVYVHLARKLHVRYEGPPVPSASPSCGSRDGSLRGSSFNELSGGHASYLSRFFPGAEPHAGEGAGPAPALHAGRHCVGGLPLPHRSASASAIVHLHSRAAEPAYYYGCGGTVGSAGSSRGHCASPEPERRAENM